MLPADPIRTWFGGSGGRPLHLDSNFQYASTVRWRRDAGAAGARALSATHFCPRPFFKEYQRLGDAAIKVLGDFTPLVERISIDEAFADVAGCTPLFGPPREIARAIRHRVRAELGIPISLGVARTKHLAKRAGGCRSRSRARFPSRPACRVDVGSGAGDSRATGRDWRPYHRAAS